MKVHTRFAPLLLCLLAPTGALSQQANVNLDWNPQQNTENLTPFSAPLNSPEVHDDRTVTFRVRAPQSQSVELNGANYEVLVLQVVLATFFGFFGFT